MREHARLARASTRKDEAVLRRQGDGLQLFGVEIGEQVGHQRSFVGHAL